MLCLRLFLLIILDLFSNIFGEYPILTFTEKHCITNSSYAVAVLEEPFKKQLRPLQYIPELEKSLSLDFTCKFNSQDQCTRLFSNAPWKVVETIGGKHGEFILDKRWNDFAVFLTEDESVNYIYSKAATIDNPNDFVIPFSIRLEEEAHLFLCDDINPPSSNCYWLLFAGWRGTQTALRKCAANSGVQVTTDDKAPKGSCGILRGSVIKYTKKNNPKPISSDVWNHFKLKKFLNKIELLDENGKILFDYEDGEIGRTFETKHLLIHSKRSPGLWKIHKYEYIASVRSDIVDIGPPFITRGGVKYCISMFVIMCSQCTIQFQIKSKKGAEYFITEKYTTPDEQWKEIKFTFSFYNSMNGVSLYTMPSSPGIPEPFWALDDIRQCQEEEYIIYESSSDTIKCQPMTSKPVKKPLKDYTAQVTSDLPITKISHSCPESTFGEHCIPCVWINNKSNFCGSLKYCELYANTTVKCSCGAGYYGPFRKNSYQCLSRCSPSKFGHNCNTTCDMCQDSCEPIEGMCYNGLCLDNFSGPKCDIPPYARLLVPPNVERTTANSCVVKITNFSLVGDTMPKFYKIQLREDGSTNWIDVGRAENFNNTVDIEITGLKEDTTYDIRGLVFTSNKNIFMQLIPHRLFQTNCTLITENDITYKVTNVTMNITLTRQKNHCRFQNYIVSINGNPIDLNEARDVSYITESNLIPATVYQLVLSHRTGTYKRNITTLEGVPGHVTDLKQVEPFSPSSINLKWTEPSEKNSAFLLYSIEYKLMGHKACEQNNSWSDVKNSTTEKTEWQIDNLETYAYYDVKVVPFNSVTTGIHTQISAETLETPEQLSPEELPDVVIDPDVNSAKIVFKTNCQKIQGPVFAHSSTICCSPWCNCIEQFLNTVVDYNKKNNLVLENLQAYSNYTAHFKFCREKDKCKDGFSETRQNFTTKTTDPGRITGLEATSTGPSIIDIRWIPPYPPMGILEYYYVYYLDVNVHYYTRSSTYPPRIRLKPKQCQLWPEYHCAQIGGVLNAKTKYNIWVIAKNEQHDLVIPSSIYPIEVQTAESAPNASYDLKVNWTNDQDKFDLFWNHPNRTNGVLKGFKIYVHQINYESKSMINDFLILNKEEYRLTYNLRITEVNLPNVFKITIVPYNDAADGIPLTRRIVSPPPVPVNFTVKPIFFENSIHIDINGVKQQNFPKDRINQTLYVLISNVSSTNIAEITDLEQNILAGNKPELKFHKIVENRNISDLSIIDIDIDKSSNEDTTKTFPFIPGDIYNISVIIVNEFMGQKRLRTVSALQKFSTGDDKTQEGNTGQQAGGTSSAQGGGGIYALILLLFLLPLVGYVFMRYRKKVKASTSLERIITNSKSEVSPSPILQPEIPLTSVPAKANSDDDEKVINVVQPLPHKPISKVRSQEQNGKYSKLVKVHDFEIYVKTSLDNGELKRQHDAFPRGLTQNASYGSIKENKSKNRYNNIVAYDNNRVQLKKIEGDGCSDYINANYIDGYKTSNAYIATQGPKANTTYDFWRMIWQEKVQHIIMLANVFEGGKKKTEKYWPEINEELVFKEIKIHFVSSEVHANFEYRSLIVTVDQTQRKVEQLHYTTWPDHGVPLYSQNLVPFLQRILKIPNSSKSPVVVHCSAGVGRTGTIILCDITLRMAAIEGSVDPFATLKKLRSQRANMVDNIEQYKLAHLVVLECLSGLNTSIPCNKDMETVVENIIGSNSIKQQIRYIKDTEWQDEAMKAMCETGEETPKYPEKNRFPDIIPENHCRVFISPYPPSDVTSSYINAITVDGFCNPGMYIVTQQPLPNTLGDFWRMVYERNVTVIISLNDIDLSDETMCQFWPVDDNEMQPVDFITLQWKNTQNLGTYTVTTIHIIRNNTLEDKKHVVRIIKFNGWKKNEKIPTNLDTFLMFLEEANAIARRSHPVIITCYDGATASGFYISMSFLIEKMKLEQECDVCQAVRSIRHNRQQFVDSEEQVKHLYTASVKFIKCFQPYSNFDSY